MRNFFYTIPESLEESALIDGANPATVLLKVVLPLSMPVLTTIGLFYAVWHWNSWFDANIYIADHSSHAGAEHPAAHPDQRHRGDQ